MPLWSSDEIVLMAFVAATFLAIFGFVGTNFEIMARHAAVPTICALTAGFTAIFFTGVAAAATNIHLQGNTLLVEPQGYAWIYGVAGSAYWIEVLAFVASMAFIFGYESSRLNRDGKI